MEPILKVIATIPVGKRPRGVHVSPDGKTVYVALSGTPISAPPQLDAQGNPILKKGGDDDDDSAKADKAADGIGWWMSRPGNSCAKYRPARTRKISP